ncbi:MAG: hypothetical protein ACRD1O_00025 [Terriglobia bacterium]
MNRIIGFWIASSAVLFLLSLVYLQHQLHRKNSLFAWWLCVGVSMQLISAYGLVLGCPAWLARVWAFADYLSYGLALAVLVAALWRRQCPVNQTLLYGLGAMIAFNALVRWRGDSFNQDLRSWLLNIAFLGPAIFLLLSFSNVRADRLPLHIKSAFENLASQVTTRTRQAAFSPKADIGALDAA